ncbi:MAG: CHASE2 domain-containing protein, partial [Clostridia bacterium]|nr:CHASE2 domain-containing protein [Clostridia bacterium]
MKNKHLFFNLSYKVILAVIFFVFCFFNIFQTIDYRIYDSLIKLRKQPQKNENVMLVKVDDPSIIKLGEWPWSRDIYADALIRMKELGAYNAMFDIEYISPSKNGIAPSAEKNINNTIIDTEANVNELINQLSNAINQGYFSIRDLPLLLQQLLDENINPSFEGLINYVDNNISRDNDEYFAQALQFFGRSYLTINHQDLGYDITKDQIDYITERILLNTVNDKNYLINIGNEFSTEESEEIPGFIPALQKLLTRAYGANFTNSIVDNDGIRRRMELLYAYNNRYITQLAFGPYLEIVKSKEIVRQKDELIIKNATDPVTGEIGDIKIPLDEHGRFLINYLKGSCDESFKTDSIINLINLDLIEEQIILCLGNLSQPLITAEDGSMLNYTVYAQELLSVYNDITQFKNYLLSKCTGYDSEGKLLDGISDEEYAQYFELRNQFYDYIKEYLSQNYLNEALERLNNLKDIADYSIIEEYTSYMNEDFDNLKYEYDAYISFIDEMRPIYYGAYCILGNTATSTTDNGATPYEKKFMNVGIHANLLNTLLTKDYIYSIRWYYGFIVAVILSFLLLLTLKMSKTQQNIISSVCFAVFAIVCASLFVFSHYYIHMFGLILYLFVDLVAGISYRFYQSAIEKKFITQIAASFANKDK